MFFETMLYAAFFAAGQGPAQPEIPLKREALLPPDAYLVKAHALSATTGGDGGRAASFEIDHVYVGTDDLKGKTFSAKIHVYMFDFNMPYYDVTPIHKGEVGIWWVKKGNQELASIFEMVGMRLKRPADALQQRNFVWTWDTTVFIPALKDGSKAGDARYEMCIARAEVYEKVYRASDKDRLKVIDDYVRSHDSIKGAAALMLLLRENEPKPVQAPKGASAKSGPKQEMAVEWRIVKYPKIADYALPFSKDESLSPRVQWEVEQLLAVNKHGWKGSPEEWTMIKRWYAGTWKERENLSWEVSDERVLADLLAPGASYQFRSTRTFTMVEKLELAVVGLANDARSDHFKAELIQSVGSGLLGGKPRIAYPDSLADADQGFSLLVRTVRKDAAPARKVAAAKLLLVFAPFSADRRATIEGLRQEKLGDDVTKGITKTLMEK